MNVPGTNQNNYSFVMKYGQKQEFPSNVQNKNSQNYDLTAIQEQFQQNMSPTVRSIKVSIINKKKRNSTERISFEEFAA